MALVEECHMGPFGKLALVGDCHRALFGVEGLILSNVTF